MIGNERNLPYSRGVPHVYLFPLLVESCRFLMEEREIIMRKTYKIILKGYFTQCLVQQRAKLCLTQSEMAELLAMDDRSYIDLDHGKSCCGAVTLALYIAFVCDDIQQFAEGLRHAFIAGKDNAA